MAVRKGSARFGSEPRPATGGRDLGVSPELDTGLARAAADRWRDADGLLPDSVAQVTRRPPITHADLFPADAKPSRLRVALFGTVAALALIGGGGLLALLFAPGNPQTDAGQQLASATPSAAVMVGTANDASSDDPRARAPARDTPAAVETPAQARPEPAADAPASTAASSAPAVDGTTTGTAPQSRWMERWSADAEPQAADAPEAFAAADEDGANEDLRGGIEPAPARAAPSAPEAPAPVEPAPAAASGASSASGVRIVGPGADAVQEQAGSVVPAAPLSAEPSTSVPETVAPPPTVADVPAASEAASPSADAAQPSETAPSAAASADDLLGSPAEEPASESAALQPQGGRPGRIVSAVNLRASGEKGAAILGTVAGGTELQVIACELWCEIVTPDGRRGFVFKDFVSTAQ